MLKIHARKLGTVAVLRLQGRIVNGETEILRNAVRSALEGTAIVLDFARVTAVDASGLGVMLELREQLQSRGIRLELVNVTRWVRRLLEVTRLDSVFQITTTVDFFPAASRKHQRAVTALASVA